MFPYQFNVDHYLECGKQRPNVSPLFPFTIGRTARPGLRDLLSHCITSFYPRSLHRPLYFICLSPTALQSIVRVGPLRSSQFGRHAESRNNLAMRSVPDFRLTTIFLPCNLLLRNKRLKSWELQSSITIKRALVRFSAPSALIFLHLADRSDQIRGKHKELRTALTINRSICCSPGHLVNFSTVVKHRQT